MNDHTTRFIVAPSNRIAMRYAHLQRLSPGARTLIDAEQVFGSPPPVTVICLVGDGYGTFSVTPHSAALSEKLFILEKMHYVSLIYRWFDQPPLLTPEEVAGAIRAAVPNAHDVTFKPPANAIDFGVVVVGYGEGRAVILPLSSLMWVDGALTLTALEGLIEASLRRANDFQRRRESR